MVGGHPGERAEFRALVEAQSGVVTRAQLLASGWTRDQIRSAAEHRWSVAYRGVYVVAATPESPVWAAVLHAGRDAVASHGTALWLAGAQDCPPPVVHVVVPATRRVRPAPGLRIHLTSRMTAAVGSPPRTSVEASTLDAADLLSRDVEVIDLVVRVIQRRTTTADRLLASLRNRSRHRWRRLLEDVLADVQDGVMSPLELRYLRDVERPHGLPRGERNRPSEEVGADGRTRTVYRDVRYPRWTTVVELDGREGHAPEFAFRDRRRDNRTTVDRQATLRYGWHEVVRSPCDVAGEVGDVLTARGWSGDLMRCGPMCAILA